MLMVSYIWLLSTTRIALVSWLQDVFDVDIEKWEMMIELEISTCGFRVGHKFRERSERHRKLGMTGYSSVSILSWYRC